MTCYICKKEMDIWAYHRDRYGIKRPLCFKPDCIDGILALYGPNTSRGWPQKINVKDLIGERAVFDGELLFKEAEKLLREETYIEIDFEGIKLITPTFLQESIGRLIGVYSEWPFSYSGLEEDDMGLVKKVIENARKYFEK